MYSKTTLKNMEGLSPQGFIFTNSGVQKQGAFIAKEKKYTDTVGRKAMCYRPEYVFFLFFLWPEHCN
jgi:hypothetical protein